MRASEHLDDSLGVDERGWPHLVLRWPAGIRDDAEVARDLAEVRSICARRDAHTLLVDARQARVPTYRQLGMILELARAAPAETSCVAVAVVSPSAAVRASVDSIRWLHLMGTRLAYFTDIEPAIAWLEDSLGEGRQTVASSSERESHIRLLRPL